MENVVKKIMNAVENAFGKDRAEKIFGYALAAWHGEKPLSKVFWIFGIAVPLALIVLFITPMTAGGRLGLSLALLILLPYTVWILKSIWACSANIEQDEINGIEKVYLTQASRAYVVMGTIIYFLALFG